MPAGLWKLGMTYAIFGFLESRFHAFSSASTRMPSSSTGTPASTAWYDLKALCPRRMWAAP